MRLMATFALFFSLGATAADSVILSGHRFKLTSGQLTYFLENAYEADFGEITDLNLGFLNPSHKDSMAEIHGHCA